MMKFSSLFVVVACSMLSFVSCTSKQGEGDGADSAALKPTERAANDSIAGTRMLAEARAQYHAGQYDTARQLIATLRQRYPLAIGARKQAILLLDSIELESAEDSLDALPNEAYLEYCRTHDGSDAVAVTKGEKPLIGEYERLLMKVKFFDRKIMEDLRHEQR